MKENMPEDSHFISDHKKAIGLSALAVSTTGLAALVGRRLWQSHYGHQNELPEEDPDFPPLV